ncbi:MAG: M48 family metallopeptidase, partial [Saezia sp.]
DLNAFATLGGHIIINKGAIDNVTSENALAMVLAHEVAHVKNRDPLTGMGTSALFSLVLAIVTGSDSGLTIIGNLTELSFSRQQESDADKDALIALRSYYGHTKGSDEFFSRILEKYGPADPLAFLSSHPDTENRLHVIRQDQVRIATFKDLVPLSPSLKAVQNYPPERSRNPRR